MTRKMWKKNHGADPEVGADEAIYFPPLMLKILQQLQMRIFLHLGQRVPNHVLSKKIGRRRGHQESMLNRRVSDARQM